MSDSERMISQDQQQQYQSQNSSIDDQNQKINYENQQHLIIHKQDNDNKCATYVFQNQDHTLGNILKVVLAGHSDVQFVGYTIPHPSQTKMNLRLQTIKNDSNLILDQGFKTVQSISKTIRQKFITQLETNKIKKK